MNCNNLEWIYPRTHPLLVRLGVPGVQLLLTQPIFFNEPISAQHADLKPQEQFSSAMRLIKHTPADFSLVLSGLLDQDGVLSGLTKMAV